MLLLLLCCCRQLWDVYETFVPQSLRSHGLAVRLCDALFSHAQQHGIAIRATCSYVANKYLAERPAMRAIVAPSAAAKRQQARPQDEEKKATPPSRPLLSPTRSSGVAGLSSLSPPYAHASLLLPPSSPLEAHHCPLPHHPVLGRSHFFRILAAIAQYRATSPSLSSVLLLFSSLSSSPRQFELSRDGLSFMLQRVLSPAERQDFLSSLLPFALQQVEELPLIFPSASLPLLAASASAASSTLHLSKLQVAAILSCSLLSMHAEHRGGGLRFSSANFEDLFIAAAQVGRAQLRAERRGDGQWDRSDQSGNNNIEKLRCMLHYLSVTARRSRQELQSAVVSFHRRSVADTRQSLLASLLSSSLPLPPFALFPPPATIEEDLPASQTVHLDFANRYIGGGVLGHGCVQEEILFSICTECLASILFTERMEENEAVLIIGAERFSSYTGYGQSFRFTGAWQGEREQLGRDEQGRPRGRRAILAIDAIPFRQRAMQWKQDAIARELLKAHAGFSVPASVLAPDRAGSAASASPLYSTLSTGNWGCGAFNGDVQLKSMLQLVAASAARRSLRYFTFGDKNCDGLQQCVQHLHSEKVTCGELLQAIIDYGSRRAAKEQPRVEQTLFDFLHSLSRGGGGRLQRRLKSGSRDGAGRAPQRQQRPIAEVKADPLAGADEGEEEEEKEEEEKEDSLRMYVDDDEEDAFEQALMAEADGRETGGATELQRLSDGSAATGSMEDSGSRL